jgi:acyl CoA:acetate/3-ketoacid CoA transferase alpha subunit
MGTNLRHGVVRQLDDGFEVVALDDVAADVAFAAACIASEQGRTVVDGCDARAQKRVAFLSLRSERRFILSTISIRNSNWPSDERGMAG